MDNRDDMENIPKSCPKCQDGAEENWWDITEDVKPEGFVPHYLLFGVMGICDPILPLRKFFMSEDKKEKLHKAYEDKAMQVRSLTGGKVYFCNKCGFYAGYGGDEDAVRFINKGPCYPIL